MTDLFGSELLLFLKEHGETNDRAVDKQAPYNRHDHGWILNNSAMCQKRW